MGSTSSPRNSSNADTSTFDLAEPKSLTKVSAGAFRITCLSISGRRVTPESYTIGEMPSKHPRIAVTADPELGQALERVRAATGTREADASLVRRLAVEGAQVELEAGLQRGAAIEALFVAMDSGAFDLDLDAIDRLNWPEHMV